MALATNEASVEAGTSLVPAPGWDLLRRAGADWRRRAQILAGDLGPNDLIALRRLLQLTIEQRTLAQLWISDSTPSPLLPTFLVNSWAWLTFSLGLRLGMIQRFIQWAQRVAAWGRI